jgi:hypothetical protein
MCYVLHLHLLSPTSVCNAQKNLVMRDGSSVVRNSVQKFSSSQFREATEGIKQNIFLVKCLSATEGITTPNHLDTTAPIQTTERIKQNN